MENIQVWKCQNLKWHNGKYSGLKVSEFESVRIWKCQDLKVSKSESIKIWKYQNLYSEVLVSFVNENETRYDPHRPHLPDGTIGGGGGCDHEVDRRRQQQQQEVTEL